METLAYVSEDERWDRIVSTMVLGDWFVHEFLLLMHKHVSDKIPTMAVAVVDGSIHLSYNKKFFDKLDDNQVRWVMYHEILHVALHHCTHRGPSDKRANKLWNYAMDLAINQLIPDCGHIRKPPIKFLIPEMFGFPKMLSMEQYLQLLRQEDQKQNSKKGNSGEGGDGDQSDSDGDDQGEGSGSGDDESPSNSGKPGKPGKDWLDKGETVDTHEGFDESEILDEVIRNKVDYLSKSSKSWGPLGAEVIASIQAAQIHQVSWERILRSFLGQMVSPSKRSSLKRPNRRFGHSLPGKVREYIDKVLLMVDSSGSVGDTALGKFLAEMNRVIEFMPVDLLIFDAKITYGPLPFDKKAISFDFVGRGGTNFDPPVRLAEERRYKSVVCLTDGDAPAIEYPVGVQQFIWCIVGNSKPPVDWGEVVRIKEGD